MKVWVYAICRDEKKIIGYFLRHYCTFAERIIIYDSESTDGTREEIQACSKAELRNWPGSDGIVDDEFMEFANEQWKEARGHADWVAFVDIDEILYHPRMLRLLSLYKNEGIEVPKVAGFTMISDRFPTTDGQIYDEIKTGMESLEWSKAAIFRGNMKWNVGRHSFNLHNPKQSETADIKLLHYRCLGMDYLRWRHERNWNRVPDRCKALNYGRNCEPGHTGFYGEDWFASIDPKLLGNVI